MRRRPSPRDIVARRLAAQAGYDWDTLHNHPGYLRELFRERADLVLAEIAALKAPP